MALLCWGWRTARRSYPRLVRIFRQADARYNSGLFHFEDEKAAPATPARSANLTIDDKVLRDILKNLYYPDSPYGSSPCCPPTSPARSTSSS